MRRFGWLGILAACSGPADDDGGRDTDPLARDCPTGGLARRVVQGLPSGTEGITIDPDGAMWIVQRDGGVARMVEGGQPAVVAHLPDPVGATWWNGAVWVASFATDEPGEDLPALYEVRLGESPVRHEVPDIARPNFLTPTPWGTLLVSDSVQDDRVFEWDDGAVRVWASGIPSPNGMAFSPDGGTLYVASTFVPAGTQPALWGVPVRDDGTAGSPARLVDLPAQSAPDGVAVHEDGRVLVALNLAQQVVRWRPGASDVEVVAEVDSPASLAFGRGGWNPCNVYATSLFGTDLWEVLVGGHGFFPPWEDAAR